MKKFFLFLILVASLSANAQFKSATLQASGLTCAMCSNAINKALSKLSFIEKVESEISTSSFKIRFKDGAAVDFDEMRKKVEGAGFSIAKLQVVTVFNNVNVKNGVPFVVEGANFNFIDNKEQVLNGEQTITIIDRNFIPAKEYKKYSLTTKAESYKTGVFDGKRVYHITI